MAGGAAYAELYKEYCPNFPPDPAPTLQEQGYITHVISPGLGGRLGRSCFLIGDANGKIAEETASVVFVLGSSDSDVVEQCDKISNKYGHKHIKFGKPFIQKSHFLNRSCSNSGRTCIHPA
eukprot:5192269-Pyramimonas_sp.AAC.1